MNHREILLYGFHFSFIFVFTLAVTRDLLYEHYFNATISSSAILASVMSYYFLHYKHKILLSSYIIIGTSVIPLFILIYFNHFGNMVIIYVILLPIIAFFLLDLKKAIVINFLIYALLIGMLYTIYAINPEAPILNNPLALINITFASMFIIFFGVFYHLAIESSLSALIHSNRQKDILLKEVHHRVKNNLNVTASILGLQSMGKSDETKDELAKSKSRIESIAIVHEMLYKQDDFDKIIFNEYVLKLKNLILSMYTINNSVTLNIKPNNNLTLELNIMIQFGLIINEILTNTLKHAKNREGVQVEISLQRREDVYVFTYQDNGVESIDIGTIKEAKGLGHKLIELSVKQLDGNLEIEYKKGLLYTIEFS